MATSIQTAGDRVENLDDMDLLVLLGLLVEELNARRDRYSALWEQEALWRRCRTETGPGTIDLELDRIVGDPVSVEQLARLLDSVASRLSTLGTTIPGTTLNTGYPVPGVRFNDFPTSRIQAVLSSVRRLVGIA